MPYVSNTSASLFGTWTVSLVLVQHCVGPCLNGNAGLPLSCMCGSDLLAVFLLNTLLVTPDN